MIIPQLHRQVTALDTRAHRNLTVRMPYEDWSHIAGLNAIFLTAAECLHAATDYPIVFVRVGQDEQGAPDFAPVGVLGLAQGENLYLEGGEWRATHFPAVMATYPFCIARGAGDRLAVCVDLACSAVAEAGEGQRLFDDQGEITPFMREAQVQLERLETQVNNTREIARRLVKLDLLRERRFDVTLADGKTFAVDGFFTVDEERVKALPDADILALNRDGLLAMIHAHWVSLSHMRRLVQWRIAREGAPTAG
jgi:hypothetical protein